jgi:hypothetical protein
VLYLLLVLILGTLIYVGWRAARSQVNRQKSRGGGGGRRRARDGGGGAPAVSTLWRLSHGDNNPR